ncbi:hypothetical protein GBF38_020298 [Nibea albiflora]|uniref:Uncharacterized protein n=1 Tax=Nibea albiflora TaxID=240163 RepID=A0ACB7FDF3_NIBAL|nr:hypothetical protein GBF38_020298 [Nibea albiflora]
MGDEHLGREEGRGGRRTPFSRNRWDMEQDASGEDVAVTYNKLSPSRCTVGASTDGLYEYPGVIQPASGPPMIYVLAGF